MSAEVVAPGVVVMVANAAVCASTGKKSVPRMSRHRIMELSARSRSVWPAAMITLAPLDFVSNFADKRGTVRPGTTRTLFRVSTRDSPVMVMRRKVSVPVAVAGRERPSKPDTVAEEPCEVIVVRYSMDGIRW